jgi:hypothetical protein
MPLLQLIVVLIVIGLCLFLVESLLPVDPAIKQVIRVVIVLAVIIWLLSLVGLIPTRIGATVIHRRLHAQCERTYDVMKNDLLTLANARRKLV